MQMKTFHKYKTIVKFMQDLRVYLKNNYLSRFKIGQHYQGEKEICFFTFTPFSLQKQKLKIIKNCHCI